MIAEFAESAKASQAQLSSDSHVLEDRLQSLGVRGTIVSETASVNGGTVSIVGSGALPVPAALLASSGIVQFRAVLCEALPYGPPSPGKGAGPLPPACSSALYSLQKPNLVVTPSLTNASGYRTNLDSIGSDPALTDQPSTSPETNDSQPDASVLVPFFLGGGDRYLLGPSELDGTATASSSVAHESSQWVVNVTLTATGAGRWDALSRKYFHEMIGIDIDGELVSNPITEPIQTSFTSFAGRVQISGSFNKSRAEEISAALNSGPLATPLRVIP